jgi:hypothetical protein
VKDFHIVHIFRTKVQTPNLVLKDCTSFKLLTTGHFPAISREACKSEIHPPHFIHGGESGVGVEWGRRGEFLFFPTGNSENFENKIGKFHQILKSTKLAEWDISFFCCKFGK